MKVAIAHDYLREYGGAERVLEALLEIFPEAPLYTAYYNPKTLGPHAARFNKHEIRTSWFQKFPFAEKLVPPFRLFAPLMFESFDMSGFDVVISSSSAAYLAKAVITKPDTLHISYIHTPPRFLYGYATSFNYKKNQLVRIFAEISNHILRIYDYQVSQRPDILVANSENVRARIQKFYRRDSEVVYPPVDMSEFKLKKQKQNFYLVINRLVKGKGTELIVQAATKLDLPLKVAGSGPELDNLKSIAGQNIEFLGWVSDQKRVELLENAKALILAAEDEDFGITAIEAQAAGTPVIAPNSGGFKETVIDGKTGVLYGEDGIVKIEDLVKAVEDFDATKFNPEDCRKQAEKFSKDRFKKEILSLIEKQFPKR